MSFRNHVNSQCLWISGRHGAALASSSHPFWKKQCEKTIARNMELYGELDDAENTIASLWFFNVIFAALFLIALGYILL